MCSRSKNCIRRSCWGSTVRVVPIVEGHGEVAAVPVLLRKLAQWRTPGSVPEVSTPIRVHKDRFLNRDEEFQRYLQLAAAKCGDDGWILILLDADEDCPAELAPQIIARANACAAHRPVSIVLAKHEYEAWFIAAASSLDGKREFSLSATVPSDAENPRDAKGWIGGQNRWPRLQRSHRSACVFCPYGPAAGLRRMQVISKAVCRMG